MPTDAAWLEHPDWPADEFYSTRITSWGLLTDAIKKSMMTNDPRTNGVLRSVNGISGMIEARRWLMDESTELAPAGYFNLHTCLTTTMIGNMALKRILRGLWLRQRDDIQYTINKLRKRHRDAILRQKQGVPPRRLKRRPDMSHRTALNICIKGHEIHRSSNEWAGVV